MKISTRILLAFGVVMSLMAGMAALNHRTSEQSQRQIADYDENLALLLTVHQLDNQVLELQRSTAIFATTGRPSLARRVERIDGTIQATLEAVKGNASDSEQAMHERLAELRSGYMEAFGRLAEDRGRRDELLASCRERGAEISARLEALANSGVDLPHAEEAFASAERSIMSYAESPDSAAVLSAKADLRRSAEIIREAGDTTLEDALADYEATFLQMVQAVRGYLFLANVVLAGQAAELTRNTAEFRDRFQASTSELLSQTGRAAERTRTLNSALIFVALVLGLAVSGAVGRSITSQVDDITQTLAGLAAGEQVGSIPGLERSDEIGEMAAAAQVFKERNQQTEELLELSRQRGAQLQKQARDLELANAELAQFAYVASHDLQEPLRMVASYVQLLGQEYEDRLDEDAREYIGFASEGARRMQALINDLLDLSRVGRTAARIAPVDTVRLVDSVCRDLHRLLEDAEARVEVGQLPVVSAYESLLRQAVQNFLTNAIKYRREGVPPHIEVTAEECAEGWVLSFADNGIGIDPRHSERIFKVFQRLHTRAEYEGSGMGLAIVKKIAEQHNGRVWVERNGEHGSVFRFLVGPLQSADGPASAAGPGDPASAEVLAA